jgi:hypothetical protein
MNFTTQELQNKLMYYLHSSNLKDSSIKMYSSWFKVYATSFMHHNMVTEEDIISSLNTWVDSYKNINTREQKKSVANKWFIPFLKNLIQIDDMQIDVQIDVQIDDSEYVIISIDNSPTLLSDTVDIQFLSIKPPSIEPSIIEPPITEPPIIDPPSIDPPSIEPPSIEPPNNLIEELVSIKKNLKIQIKQQKKQHKQQKKYLKKLKKILNSIQ